MAMGSGSEVTKQAARMILTDDNFGTLVHAVELGRRVYAKIVSYVRFQMTQLLSLVMLFIAATAFDINQGVALTPTMVLFLLFFVHRRRGRGHHRRPGRSGRDEPPTAGPEGPDHQPDRDPVLDPLRRSAFRGRPGPARRRPGRTERRQASASMTMTFVVMGLGTVFNALTNRRDPTSGLTAPILQALAISLVPVAMIVLATQLPGLQAGLLTTSLTGLQWLECVGLALLLPIVIEVGKVDPPPACPASGGRYTRAVHRRAHAGAPQHPVCRTRANHEESR